MASAAHPRTTRTPPAPGDLELVRAFLSLHDHEPGNDASLPPSAPPIRAWLLETALLEPSDPADEADLRWAGEVRGALRALMEEHMGSPRDDEAIALVDRATAEVGLSPRFGLEGLVPSVGGVKGAIGTVLAIAFLSQLDGS